MCGTFVTIEEQYWYILINSVYSLFKFPYFFLLKNSDFEKTVINTQKKIFLEALVLFYGK